MDLSKQTKNYFYELVKKLYDNDPRISKELLFTDNELNINGICFMKHITTNNISLDLLNTYGISMLCFKIPFSIDYNSDRDTRDKIFERVKGTRFESHSSSRYYYYVSESIENMEREYTEKYLFPLVKEKLESFIQDTDGFYYFNVSYDGFWVYLVSPNNVAFDLMENSKEKSDLLGFDTLPEKVDWEQALEKLLG